MNLINQLKKSYRNVYTQGFREISVIILFSLLFISVTMKAIFKVCKTKYFSQPQQQNTLSLIPKQIQKKLAFLLNLNYK